VLVQRNFLLYLLSFVFVPLVPLFVAPSEASFFLDDLPAKAPVRDTIPSWYVSGFYAGRLYVNSLHSWPGISVQKSINAKNTFELAGQFNGVQSGAELTLRWNRILVNRLRTQQQEKFSFAGLGSIFLPPLKEADNSILQPYPILRIGVGQRNLLSAKHDWGYWVNLNGAIIIAGQYSVKGESIFTESRIASTDIGIEIGVFRWWR
jgi:hypothetical protein